MPIDPRDITPVQEGPQITEDRKCSACDYSLQGLHIGMRCPECGQPIRQVGGEARESLTDAPIGYLKGARFGFGLLFWSLLAISAYIVAFGGSGKPGDHGDRGGRDCCVVARCLHHDRASPETRRINGVAARAPQSLAG